MAIKKTGATKELPETRLTDTQSAEKKPNHEAAYGKVSPPTNGLANTQKNDSHETKPTSPFGDTKKRNATRVTVHYDVGFQNTLYIRGKGANLNWEKGTPLKNLSHDEWIWETEAPFTQCEFKVLINDQEFEQGENHYLTCGKSIHYTPHF